MITAYNPIYFILFMINLLILIILNLVLRFQCYLFEMDIYYNLYRYNNNFIFIYHYDDTKR